MFPFNVSNIIKKIRLRKSDYIKVSISIFCLVFGLTLKGKESNMAHEANTIASKLQEIEQIKSSNVYKVFQARIINPSNKEPFEEISKNAVEKEKGEIRKLFQRDRVNYHGIDKLTYKIEALIWHDKSAFQIIDTISKINGGIVFINKFEIEKIARTNLESPFIKVIISCELYQKY